MYLLDRFFTHGLIAAGHGHALPMSHDPWLVTLSIVVACVAAFTSFVLLDQLNASSSRLPKWGWLAVGSFAMGSGIWSMHFIAMLAMEMADSTFYNFPITIISVLFAIGASATAFRIVTVSHMTNIRLAVGGVLMGAGIGAMHYIGMAAIYMRAEIRYDPALFGLSVVVAVVLSTLALWLMRAQQESTHRRYRILWRFAAAIIMGVSIAGMHYTGMAAANFIPTPDFIGPTPHFGSLRMAELVIVGIAMILLLSFAPTIIDQSYRIEQLSSQLSAHGIFDDAGIASDAVIVFSADGRIETVNRAAEKAFGYSSEDAVGLHIDSLFAPGNLDRYRAHASDPLLSGVRTPPDVWGVRKDGIQFLAELSLTGIVLKRGQRTLCVCRDITLRRMADEAMRIGKERAEHANRAKSEFLAMMSHEIRTPMNGVLGMTELLLDTPLNPEQHSYADAVLQSGKALMTIINDILDISKLEAGQVALETIDYDPRTLIAELEMLFRLECTKKKIALNICIDPAVPQTLVGDPGRIRQVLMNLIGNAIKFTEKGSVTVFATLDEHSPDANRVRFDVIDTGIGIDKEAQTKLFEKFIQADLSTTRKYGGTGLGLAICQNLIDLMSGKIGVVSEPGKGSKFWFSIPLAAVADQEPRAAA